MNSFTPCDKTTLSYAKDGKVIFACNTDEFKQGLEYMHDLYEEGLISTEYFTMDGETQKALAKEGNFLIYASILNEISDVPEVFKQYTALAPVTFDEGVAPVASVTAW